MSRHEQSRMRDTYRTPREESTGVSRELASGNRSRSFMQISAKATRATDVAGHVLDGTKLAQIDSWTQTVALSHVKTLPFCSRSQIMCDLYAVETKLNHGHVYREM